MSDLITSDPKIRHGQWCLTGTRMPVSTVVSWVRTEGVETFRRQFPGDYTDEQIDACLAWTFPPIFNAPPRADVDYATCVCGETAELDDVGDIMTCRYCHRRYRAVVQEITEDDLGCRDDSNDEVTP